MIHDKAVDLPDTKFALVPPILRLEKKWYTNEYEGICKFFNKGVKAMIRNNVTKTVPMSIMSQQFKVDRVLLTKNLRKLFIEMAFQKAEIIYKAPIVELDLREGMEVKGRGASSRGNRLGQGAWLRLLLVLVWIIGQQSWKQMWVDIFSHRFFDS
jgi:hypothetical protein